MNKKIILGVISIIGLITVVALGWSAYAHRTAKPEAHTSLLKDRGILKDASKPLANVLPTPSTVSTTLKIVEGISHEEAMNVYWLSRINELRQQKKLEPLVFDSRLAHTANIWAVYMGTNGILTHDRPNGDKMNEWIKAYNLPFSAPVVGGGYRNTFTENIGRAYADTSLKSLQAGLDQVLTSMVDEGPEGVHYRTIFSPNWNRYGGGFYFEPIAKGRVRVYMAFHYASLQ